MQNAQENSCKLNVLRTERTVNKWSILYVCGSVIQEFRSSHSIYSPRNRDIGKMCFQNSTSPKLAPKVVHYLNAFQNVAERNFLTRKSLQGKFRHSNGFSEYLCNKEYENKRRSSRGSTERRFYLFSTLWILCVFARNSDVYVNSNWLIHCPFVIFVDPVHAELTLLRPIANDLFQSATFLSRWCLFWLRSSSTVQTMNFT